MYTSDADPRENSVLATSPLKKREIFLQRKKNWKFKDSSICLHCVPKPPRKRNHTIKVVLYPTGNTWKKKTRKDLHIVTKRTLYWEKKCVVALSTSIFTFVLFAQRSFFFFGHAVLWLFVNFFVHTIPKIWERSHKYCPECSKTTGF